MNSRYGFDHLGSLGGGAPPPPAALGCGAGNGGRLPHPLRGSPLKRGPWGQCFGDNPLRPHSPEWQASALCANVCKIPSVRPFRSTTASLGCGAGRRGTTPPVAFGDSPLKRGPWGGCFAGAAGGGLGGAALEGLSEISRPTGSLAAGMRIPCGASRSGKALISWRNRPGGRRPPRRPPGSHRR